MPQVFNSYGYERKRWIIMSAILLVFAVLGMTHQYSDGLWELAPGEELQWANVAWMITATIFVLMMTPGLSFFYGGMVGQKNVISTILQSFIAMGLVSVLWVTVGFSLSFGEDVAGLHLIGDPRTFFMFENVGAHEASVSSSVEGIRQLATGGVATTIPIALFALFQMKFAIITPSLITGSFAERVRFSAYLVFMVLFCFFVYFPLAHWTWHPSGFLNLWGVHDFAGGIVVHASSGVAALAGALFLGKRKGATHEEPANIPFVILGAALLWLGWFGFNGGSSLAADHIAVLAFLNTNTAAATAMLTWIFIDCLRGRKPSAMGAAVGSVVGLVAITPMADQVTPGEAIGIGLITTLVCNTACYWKNKKGRFDDALDVFPTHGMGGIFATLLTGVFMCLLHEENPDWAGMGLHILGLAIVCGYTFVVSLGLYWLTNKMIPMRVSAKSEALGLDISQHNEHYGFADHAEAELEEVTNS